MKKRGFTLIELIAVILILGIISLIAIPVVNKIIKESKIESFKTTTDNIVSAIEDACELQVLKDEPITTTYTFTDGVVSPSLNLKGKLPTRGTVTVDSSCRVSLIVNNGTFTATKILSEDAVKVVDGAIPMYVYYDETKGVNKPQLATGMTPIKWNGTTWVDTTAVDTDWYNYTTTDKKWANARTADGSMWVWIPRYVYRISSGWHSNTAGTIDVQYSIDTDDTRDGTVTLDTRITSNASNNKWTNHPAFTFGTTELAGIWVAKFEASGTTSAVDFKPNVVSLRSTTISNMFDASRNMETNNRYGWGISGIDIDTHMMKNSEWGAVAYLSKSTYGKNAEIWINPNSNYTTGCAGGSVLADATTSCNTYDTTNGQQASTTGNIYGIYDISGGAIEYISAYVNNGNANLATYGSSIINADAKYKDIYTVTSDSIANNYNNAIDKKGDAVYETSNNISGSYSWFGDFSSAPSTTGPWFIRGGSYSPTFLAGVFSFVSATGGAGSNSGFRGVVLVGTGL